MSAPAYPPVIAAALLKAQRAVRPVEGRGKGWDDRGRLFRFALAEDVIEAARGPLLDAGLMFVPSEWAIEERGTTAWVARPVALIHESGAALCWTVRWPLVPGHGRPMDKAIAAAATTSLAYALRDLLQIPRPNAGDDVDDRSKNATPADRLPAGGGPAAPPPPPKAPPKSAPPEADAEWRCRLSLRGPEWGRRTAPDAESAAVLACSGLEPRRGSRGGPKLEPVDVETPEGLRCFLVGYDDKAKSWSLASKPKDPTLPHHNAAPLPGSKAIEGGSEVERALGVETGALFGGGESNGPAGAASAASGSGNGSEPGSADQPGGTSLPGPSTAPAAGTVPNLPAPDATPEGTSPDGASTQAAGPQRDLPNLAETGAPDRRPAQGSQAQESERGPTGPDSAPPATSPLAPTPADPAEDLKPTDEAPRLADPPGPGPAVAPGPSAPAGEPQAAGGAPTAKQLDAIRHALGMDYDPPHAGRRYFCAATGDADMEDLVRRGLMEHGGQINGSRDRYYFVTEAGRGAVGDMRPLDDEGNPARLTYSVAFTRLSSAAWAVTKAREEHGEDSVAYREATEKRDAARKILLSVAARCAECDEPMDPEAGSCPSASCPTHDAEDLDAEREADAGDIDAMEAVEAQERDLFVACPRCGEPMGAGHVHDADDAWGSDSPQAKAREEELSRQARAAAPTPAAEKRKRHVYRGTGNCRNCGAKKGAEAPCPGKGATT